MNGIAAMTKAGEGGLIKITNQPGRLHLVWRDKGSLRICRPSILEYTYSVEDKEWEIVDGNATNLAAYEKILSETDLKQCNHCIQWSKLV